MKFWEAVIGWSPNGDVEVVGADKLGNRWWRSRHQRVSGGFLFLGIEGEPAKLAALAHYHMLVARDKVDPQKAHRALLNIEEFRDAIAADSLPAPGWRLAPMRPEPKARRRAAA